MKTIEELAPTWTSVTEEKDEIPGEIDKTVNGDTSPHIADPRCCFVGEARGGGCYYDTIRLKKGIDKRGMHIEEDYEANPEYCYSCYGMSMEFFHLSENGLDKIKYKKLCKKYAKHYDKTHNGDKCKQ